MRDELMSIVGIDFGTTNMRISTWDKIGFPQSCVIAADGSDSESPEIMPAVAVLKLLANGDLKVIVGEDAIKEADTPGTSKIIRNIKRCVLAQDSYTKARIGETDIGCLPHRWNKQQNCVEVQVDIDGQEIWFSAKEIISQILKEAVTRAGLPDEFEWRAGCPVHADIKYREMLKDLLPNPSGKSKLGWVIEEPVLVLESARNNFNPDFENLQGSFLVYDLGGGSFDCAVVQVSGEDYVVYSADGDPRLGAEDLHNNNIDKTAILKRSLMSLRDAYINAKVIWARGDDDYPFGEIIRDNDETGEVRFVWQLDYRFDIPKDMRGVIVFGGITKQDPDFENYLRRWFGEDKVFPVRDFFEVGGILNPELLAISWGACFLGDVQNSQSATVPIRLPIHVTLENLKTGDKVKYNPYHHFSQPEDSISRLGDFWDSYRSKPLLQDKSNPGEYEITITDPDGVVLRDDEGNDLQLAFSGFMEPRKLLQDEGNRQPATSLQLVIDRLGYIWVEMKSEGVGVPWTKQFRFPDIEREPDALPPSPPWQTDSQKEAWVRLQERIKKLEEKKRRQVWDALNNQPWRDRGR